MAHAQRPQYCRIAIAVYRDRYKELRNVL